jgi:hypothetical protein
LETITRNGGTAISVDAAPERPNLVEIKVVGSSRDRAHRDRNPADPQDRFQ